MDLDQIEEILASRSLSSNTRRAIRNCKICIIDDKLAELKTFVAALRNEGFNNLVEKRAVLSIHELITADFDLIVLDLSGIAGEIFTDDGLGVLHKLKTSAPSVPVLVVTGSSFTAESSKTLNLADAIRNKPISPSDLATEVEDLLKYRKDHHWGGLAVLRELQHLTPTIEKRLTFWQKFLLNRQKKAIAKSIIQSSFDTLTLVIKILELAAYLDDQSSRLCQIIQGMSGE
jgi:DNA-binding response OmpR family regulator